MFGGLLASAIAIMDGLRGLSSWRWIFILEGVVTILIGITSFFVISDFPEDVAWLTQDERAFVIARAKAGMDKRQAQPITPHNILRFFSDPKNLLGGIMYFGESYESSGIKKC